MQRLKGSPASNNNAAMKKLQIVMVALLVGAWTASTASALPAEVEKLLGGSEYVYIASTRKDGSLGKAAEIWFMYRDGAVYVGTSPTSWRVKRIQWGRPGAKIWVGKRDGPSFAATGELVDDDRIEGLLLETYAEKYPAGWKRYEESFRKGFADGSRVIVKYSPGGAD
jgi:hypothetical protein